MDCLPDQVPAGDPNPNQIPSDPNQIPQNQNPGPTYKCCYCPEQGLNEKDLIVHIMKFHGNQKGVCPICSVSPGGDPTYESDNCLAHLQLRHNYDWQNF
jgi:hypothetical protein